MTMNKRRMMFVSLAGLLALACTCGPLTQLASSGTGGGSSTGIDECDASLGLDTTLTDQIAFGETKTGTMSSIYEAHDYQFDGASGQQVTIRAVGVGDADPRVCLLDASRNVLGVDDDGGGGVNALLTVTLPSNGTYTIRVDMFSGASFSYELSLN